MGNIILSNNFVDSGDITVTARTTTTGYNPENVLDNWNLKKRYRANDVIVSDYLLHFDFGLGLSIASVFLNDVNFSNVIIQGSSDDTWSSPDFETENITVYQNGMTGRYQVYIPLEEFNYQYMRVFIPSSASVVGPYHEKWEVGTVCLMQTAEELSHNMSYGYVQSSQQLYKDSYTKRIRLWDTVRWRGRLAFGNRASAYETDLKTIAWMDMASPMVFYENRGNTSAAYLCVRDDEMEITEFTCNGIQANTIGLKEAFMVGI